MISINRLTIVLPVPVTALSQTTENDFIQYATPVLRVVSSALLLQSFSVVWLNAVTGTGNTMVNLLIEIITLIIYTAYVYFVLEVWNLSITWGWISEWVYWISMFSMSYIYMKSGRWKGKDSSAI